MVKVIASSLRKGNVVEHDDGKLYIVLVAENIHPGKGNSVTKVDMRRISDGVKVAASWRTVEMVEKIAQRVVAQISEKAVREIAWEVIPDLAEALIKQEIERLKAELQKI